MKRYSMFCLKVMKAYELKLGKFHRFSKKRIETTAQERCINCYCACVELLQYITGC